MVVSSLWPSDFWFMKRRGLTQFSRLYLFWTLRITFFFLLGRWLPRLGPARPGSARRAPTRAMFPLGARNLGVSTGSRRCQASELISIDRISTAPISRNLWGPVSVSLSLLLFRAEAGSKIPLLDAPTRCINSKKVRRGTVGKCWKGEKLADRCFRQRIRNIHSWQFHLF